MHPPFQPEQDACNAKLVTCPTYTSVLSYQGIGRVNDLPYGRNFLLGEKEQNSMWLRLEVQSAGQIVFTISPVIASNNYDFAVIMLQPARNQDCSNFPGSSLFISNFNNNLPGSNDSGKIGLSYASYIWKLLPGAFGRSFCTAMPVNAGGTYLIMINNAGDDNNPSAPMAGFTIDFSGSTAVFYDDKTPSIVPNASACDPYQELILELTNEVFCNSIAPDGSDFYLKPSGLVQSAEGINCGSAGYTKQVKVVFSGTLPDNDYTLYARKGTDGNTLTGFCGTQLALPDSLNFRVNTMSYLALDSPSCQQAFLRFKTPVYAASIAKDGSDFLVSGPAPVTIVAAEPVDPVNGRSSLVKLTFAAPVATDGDYQLIARVGSDGNTLTGECERPLPIGASLPFSIHSYNGLLTALPDTVVCGVGTRVTLYGLNRGLAPERGFRYAWGPDIGIAEAATMEARITIREHFNDYVLETLDSNGCYLRDSVHIAIVPFKATPLPAQLAACEEDTVIIQVAGVSSCNWFKGPGFEDAAPILNCTDCASVAAYPEVGTTVLFVVARDDRGCPDTLQTEIMIYPRPLPRSFPRDTTIFFGNSVLLRAQGGVYYTWDEKSSLDNGYSATPLATPRQSTLYTVTAVNEYGCIRTASSRVNVTHVEKLLVPNAFSPNGDGINDVFRVENAGMLRPLEFRVFDRWGNLVFDGSGSNTGWDGTFKGMPMNADVYYYTISMDLSDGRVHRVTGDVTLIR